MSVIILIILGILLAAIPIYSIREAMRYDFEEEELRTPARDGHPLMNRPPLDPPGWM